MILPWRAGAQGGLLENKGRMPDFVTFTRQFGNGMSYYRKDGYTILLKNRVEYDSFWKHFHLYKSLQHDFTLHYHRFDMQFLGASGCEVKTEYPLSTYYNFYKGRDPRNWHTKVHAWQQLTYAGLYPGISWQIQEYGDAVKHNFIVDRGANPASIRMSYRYTGSMSVLEDGSLQIKTSVGDVTEQTPYAFQLINGDTVNIKCTYALKKRGDAYEVSFNLGNYDKAYPLVIDPILVFSTYSGSKGDNFGFTSTYDSRSHLYGGGIVDGGAGSNGGPFPVTPGAFQTVYSGGVGNAPANLPCDIGINKFDSAGTMLLYSTYLGGGKDEYPHSLVVDREDNLLVMGTAYSNDFPVDTGAYDGSFNGNTDIFIVKLKWDGSEMLGGTFIGGADYDGLNTRSLRYNYADDFRGDIVVDSNDNIYVASTTQSIDFPVKNAFQATRSSAQDGCVFSFDPLLRKLRFSSYIGGNGDDAMYSIRLFDTFVYAGGGTSSSAMAFAVNGNKNSYTGGRADGFIVKLNESGKLLNSTYFGTVNYDQIYFLDVDEDGQIYAAGQTDGNIPRTAGTYGKDRTSQFIIRYSPNMTVINLSTTFGNRTFNPEISPSAFLVDKCDNIYFSGWGSPIDFGNLHSLTTRDLQYTADAIQKTTDNEDFYLMVMSKDARTLLFATYYGGNKTEDHVDGGTSRFDKKGVVYQSVCASCPGAGGNQDFPVTLKAPFKTNSSPRCSNATFKIDFQINYEVDAKFTANPTNGCQPLKVQFTNNSKKARQYRWDFGDGSGIDTTRNPTHTFSNPGTYKVVLTSVDSFSCNISEYDSTFIVVKQSPKADFEYSTEECSREFSFKNKSENYADPVWNFGDSSQAEHSENPAHKFTKDGDFRVLLTVRHPASGCIDTQSVIIQMYGNPALTLKVPNVFTPNDDNKNDCYTIGGISPNCDEAEIWVYDRWGLLVFHGNLPTDCWDGTYKGNPLATGVYYYILKLKSKNPDNQAYVDNGSNSGKDKSIIEGVIHLIR